MAECECPPDIENRHYIDCLQRRDRLELDQVLADLRRAHDAFVLAERAVIGILRRSGDREKGRGRRKRLLDAGSCQNCGAEAYPGRTRCTPCGQRNSETTKRRKERAA